MAVCFCCAYQQTGKEGEHRALKSLSQSPPTNTRAYLLPQGAFEPKVGATKGGVYNRRLYRDVVSLGSVTKFSTPCVCCGKHTTKEAPAFLRKPSNSSDRTTLCLSLPSFYEGTNKKQSSSGVRERNTTKVEFTSVHTCGALREMGGNP